MRPVCQDGVVIYITDLIGLNGIGEATWKRDSAVNVATAMNRKTGSAVIVAVFSVLVLLTRERISANLRRYYLPSNLS